MPYVWASESLCPHVESWGQWQESKPTQWSVSSRPTHTLGLENRNFWGCVFALVAGRRITESNCHHLHQWHCHQFTLGQAGWRHSSYWKEVWKASGQLAPAANQHSDEELLQRRERPGDTSAWKTRGNTHWRRKGDSRASVCSYR